MNLEASVHTIAKSYIHAMCAGLVPLFLFFVMRCFIDAFGQTRVTMIITLLTTPINIALNYIFGKCLEHPSLANRYRRCNSDYILACFLDYSLDYYKTRTL